MLTRAYRRRLHTGLRGRPPWRLPAGLALTQRIKQWDPPGHLVRIDTAATIGPLIEPPATVRVERLNGVLRDRLNALTRKTHAFAKTAETWDALLQLALFEHNWLRPHPALRCTPAMALGLADHRWRWPEFLTTPPPISR